MKKSDFVSVFFLILLFLVFTAPGPLQITHDTDYIYYFDHDETDIVQSDDFWNYMIFEPAFPAVTLTATKTDAFFTDHNSNTEFDPGDVISYTIAIQNSGDMAEDVIFDDTIDPNTTLVGGSLSVTPIARNDSYTTTGNISISVPDGTGDALGNDSDPDGGALTVTEVQSSAGNVGSPTVTTATGLNSVMGSVTMQANGSFSYEPPPGFTGTDTFTYQVTDDEGDADTATVSIVISDRVWFVDNSSGGSNLGTFSNPFTNITSFNSAQGASGPNPTNGDVIFIYKGSSNYTNGINLRDSQVLLGQGIDLLTELGNQSITLSSFSDLSSSPASGAGNRPVLTDGSDNGIALASANTIKGLNVGNTSGIGITGTSVGNLTIDEVGITGSGKAFDVDGGTLNVDLNEVTVTSSSGGGFSLQNTSGTTTIANVDITTSGGTGLLAGSAGTFTVTGSGNQINATSGTAVNLTNTTIGGAGSTFQTISASGGANGIILNNTGPGGFTVTGMGINDGSGGTIQNITNRGVEVINTDNVSLNNMNFTNAATTNGDDPTNTTTSTCNNLDNSGCNAPVHLKTVTGVTLDNVQINESVQQGINGLDVANFRLLNSQIINAGDQVNEGCLQIVNLSGTSEITDSDLGLPSERVAMIKNTSGTLNLTIDGSTFRDTQSSVIGADGLELTFFGSSTASINVIDSFFMRNSTNGLQVFSEDDSVVGIDITGSIFDRETGIGIGMDLAAADAGDLTFNVIGNPLINANGGPAVNVFANDTSTIRGRINNNPDIQAGGASASGMGIRVQVNENSKGVLDISGNTVSDIGFDAGIQVISRLKTSGANGRLDATIDNNNVTVDAASLYDIWVQANDNNTTCANVTNNTTSGNGGSAFRQRTADTGSTVLLQGFTTDATTTWNNNSNTPAGSVNSSNNGTLGGGTCETVSHPLPIASSSLTNQYEQLARASYPFESEAINLRSEETFRTKNLEIHTNEISSALTQQRNTLKIQTNESDSPLTTGATTAQTAPVYLAGTESVALPFPGEPVEINEFGTEPLLSRTPAKINNTPLISPAVFSGENVNVNLGTLDPGQEVTIEFRATIDDPLPGGVDRVQNQATISGSNFVDDVLTTDPDPNSDLPPAGGETITPVNVELGLTLTIDEGWRMLASPIAGFSYDDMIGDLWTQGTGISGADYAGGTPNVYTWPNDEPGTDQNLWEPVGNLNDPILAGTGFLMYVFKDDEYGDNTGWSDKTITLSGPTHAGDISPAMNSTPDGWTLVGNPYGQPIEFSALIKVNLVDAAYVYDLNAMGIDPPGPINGNGGAWRSISGSYGDIPSGNIAPGQGFFVQNDGAGSLTFTEASKTTGGEFYGKQTEPRDFVRLEVRGQSLYNSAWIRFSEDGSADPTGGEALELQPLSRQYALLGARKADGTLMDIAHFPLNTQNLEIPLAVETTRSGPFTIRATDLDLPAGMALYLYDRQTGESMPLRKDVEYTFDLEVSDQGKNIPPYEGGTKGGIPRAKAPTPQEILAIGAIGPNKAKTTGTDRFLITTSPGVPASELPDEVALGQNYPNPFNPTTVISYQIPVNSEVKLEVYDMLGRRVATLVDGQIAAGTHQISFTASGLSSGIYLYRLQAGSTIMTKKLTILK